jgi:DeoR/GlpR family transcriptional regulator of sugar metabolism
MKVATRVIVAADQTKLGRSALVKIADLSDISILVSDAPKRNRTVAAAIRLGVQVVSVQPRSQSFPESAERNPA